MVTYLSLQIAGVIFALAMLFITFYFFKKNTYTYRSLTGWFFVWMLFLLFVLFPDTLNPVLKTLKISSRTQFFMIAGMFFFSAIVFALFVSVKRLEKRMELLVARLAKEFPVKKKKK